MIRVIAEDLGPSKSYTRREMRAIVGGQWSDGRDATVILDMQHSRRRYIGGRHCKTITSGYSVARVPAVGTQGLVVVWDKLFPIGEHDDDREGVQKPPYTVRLDQHGQISCSCMAGICLREQATCRHTDATISLAENDVFSEQPQGI